MISPIQLHPWLHRSLLAMVAVVGTVVYVGSFYLAFDSQVWSPIAQSIGIAAGISWPIFGVLLLYVVKARPSLLAWVDVCLKTMALGIALLLPSMFLNAIAYATSPSLLWWSGALATHVVLLAAANIIMGVTFVRLGRCLFARPQTLVCLWVFALDGTFLVLLWMFTLGRLQS